MMIESARYSTEAEDHIVAVIDGAVMTIPVDITNRHYRDIIEQNIVIAAYAPPQPTADDIKAEAQRRIIDLTGASDLNSCVVKQLNALMRATELTNKKASGVILTSSEEAEATALAAMAAAVKAIRARSDVIEAMSPIPTDFREDSYWS